jgi:hypothetical protein
MHAYIHTPRCETNLGIFPSNDSSASQTVGIYCNDDDKDFQIVLDRKIDAMANNRMGPLDCGDRSSAEAETACDGDDERDI